MELLARRLWSPANLPVPLGLKLTQKIDSEIARNLLALKGQSPMSLAGDFKARRIMEEMIEAGYYVIEPKCKAEIERAIIEAAESEVPIMPVTDFELVAYAEADGSLVCEIEGIRVARPQIDRDTEDRIKKLNALIEDEAATDGEREAARRSVYRLGTTKVTGLFTKGRSYKVDSETYNFSESFEREKVHLEESTLRTYTSSHSCKLSGRERKVIIRDNFGDFHEFLDRPDPAPKVSREVNGTTYKVHQHPEPDLWDIFVRPVIQTVAEAMPDKIAYHNEVMDNLEMVGGFTFKPGQRDYLARFTCKDFGLPAAETGVGKTLLAIAASAMKGAAHTLIIAPQGTVVDSVNAETGELSVAQWIEEINFFAPWADVYSFRSEAELNAHRLPDGSLPNGYYITYYEALFRVGARESAPKSWSSKNIYPLVGRDLPARHAREGDAHGGYRDLRRQRPQANGSQAWVSVAGYTKPSPTTRKPRASSASPHPASLRNTAHEFDMVIADEAHKACNLNAQLTDALIRMQPKYKFAFTATPIPNKASNLFSLLGWLCVPDWYKGDRCNAAFPYRREDMGRFCDNFLSNERDLTAEDLAAQHNKSKPKPKVSPDPIESSSATQTDQAHAGLHQ